MSRSFKMCFYIRLLESHINIQQEVDLVEEDLNNYIDSLLASQLSVIFFCNYHIICSKNSRAIWLCWWREMSLQQGQMWHATGNALFTSIQSHYCGLVKESVLSVKCIIIIFLFKREFTL